MPNMKFQLFCHFKSYSLKVLLNYHGHHGIALIVNTNYIRDKKFGDLFYIFIQAICMSNGVFKNEITTK